MSLFRTLKSLNLKMVLSPGEHLHPGKNFSRLRASYDALQTTADKINFFMQELPAAASVGIPTLNNDELLSLREKTRTHLQQNSTATGRELGLGYLAQTAFNDPREWMVANSEVLSFRDIEETSKVKAHSGATAFIFFQCRTSRSGKPLELHAMFVVEPDDASDGEPWHLEVIYNLSAIEGVDPAIIEEIFALPEPSIRVVSEPRSFIEKLLTSDEVGSGFGPKDVVSVGPIGAGTNALGDIHAKLYGWDREGEIPWANKAVLEFKLGKAQHERTLANKALVEMSHTRGSAVSTGNHNAGSSCLLTPLRMMFGEAPGINGTLHANMKTAINQATKVYLTDKNDVTVAAFLKDKTLMKLVTKSVVEDKLTFLLDQETLKKGKDGDIGYHTMYCKHSELHPDEDAQYLYKEAAYLVINLI